MYTPGIVLINNRTVSIVGHGVYFLHVQAIFTDIYYIHGVKSSASPICLLK